MSFASEKEQNQNCFVDFAAPNLIVSPSLCRHGVIIVQGFRQQRQHFEKEGSPETPCKVPKAAGRARLIGPNDFTLLGLLLQLGFSENVSLAQNIEKYQKLLADKAAVCVK